MGSPFRGAPALLVLFAARAVHADPGELRLEDVVAVAVRQSPELERARIDVEAARAELLRAEGIEDTRIGAGATALASQTASTDPNGDVEQRRVGVEVSARRALSTGGTLSIRALGARNHLTGNERDVNGKVVITGIDRAYSTALEIGLAQPLLRGAGSTAFEAPIRQAAKQRDAAALGREARARDLLVALAQAYWRVAFAQRQLEVRNASLDLAQRQLVQTQGAIRAEKLARSEALAVEQAIAIRKQDVIAAEQELYERSVALRQLAGLEIGPDAIAVKTEPLPATIAGDPLDLGAVLRGAFERSAELAALEARRHASEIAVKAADDAARSQLDLDLTASAGGADTTAGKSLSSAVDDPGYTVTASLTFDRAIERRGERGGQAVARAAAVAAKLDERGGRARLAVRVTGAVQRANAALARIALGDEAIGLAEQNITAEQKRFELGKSTNFEVLRRQEELEQARLRHVSAITDYLTARADLDGLSGAILARYHIVMQ